MNSRHCLLIAILLVFSCSKDDEVKPPSIISITPTQAFPGDIVSVTGENFTSSVDNVSVQISGVNAPIVDHSPTRLQIEVPEANSGQLIVTVFDQQDSYTNDFTVLINMDKELEKFLITNPDVPSIAMAAIKDGEIFYTGGTGFFDAGKSKTASENTLYLSSSLAKLMVSVAIMQQVEKGKLNLDEDVSDFIGFEIRNPNFPDTPITTRMLMQHNTSLSNPIGGEAIDELFLAYDPDSLIALFPTIRDAITPDSKIYNSAIWMNEQPGSLYKNSNYGITLLGYLVEQLSGMHYNDYTRINIMEPLGMFNSDFYYPNLNENKVAAIFSSLTGEAFEPYSFFFYPAGMLFTSPEEWSRFLLAILNEGTLDGVQILQPSSIQSLLDVKVPSNNQLAYSSNIGLVWREAAINPGWIGHTGAGIVTHISEINPELNVGYVVMTNKNRGGPELLGPGSSMNIRIHEWLLQQID